MMIIEQRGLTFDDVYLVPRKGYTNSRNTGDTNVDVSTQLTPRLLKMKYPLISANMDTVTEADMMIAMRELGGLGIVHRFMPPETQRSALNKRSKAIACIGVTEKERERLQTIKKGSFDLAAVLIDTAHGHSRMMIDQIKWVRDIHPTLDVIAGNVCTFDAAQALIRAGATCIKVGVGPGSMCTTRVQTGNGVPQLSAIMDVRSGIDKVYSQQRDNEWRPKVIADGGIRSSGDIVKALAAGADAVMMGSMFAATDEAPGEVETYQEATTGMFKKYKKYRGCASRDFQEDWKGEAKNVEGESSYIECRGQVASIFNTLIEGILSGMAYQGADNLEDLYNYAEFGIQTAAGTREGKPHGLK